MEPDNAGGATTSKKVRNAKLDALSKDELVDRIRQLEFHVNQLKNVIAKGNGEKTKGKTKIKPGRPFDFTRYNTRHVALKVAYLGWDYKGFVVQEDTVMTIEAALFESLLRTRLIESRETSNYHRCGRTDKGVSAFCQVVSIDLRSNLTEGCGVIIREGNSAARRDGNKLKEIDYAKLLNKTLPPEIRVLAWSPVEPNFSARFDCNQRMYKYFLPRGDLDLDLMNEAAAKLIGEHDFRNFCKMDVGNGVVTYIRRIDSVDISCCEEESDGYSMCTLTVVGKAFLWHQIRCVVAVLFMIGKKCEKPSLIDELFDIEKNPCKPQYTMASELPLNLYDCSYEDMTWIYDQEESRDVIAHYQKLWAQEKIKSCMLRNMLDDLSQASGVQCFDQADFLLSDYRKYASHKPLLERIKCSSLEDRVDHFSKRRKIEKFLDDETESLTDGTE